MIYLLPHTILESASRHPEAIAFRCGAQSLSYGEMAAQMNQLAHLLIDQGVKPGDRVGVYLNRCFETALAIYGVMTAGAVYVPLDPQAPPSRTQYLVNDCGIQIVISSPAQKRPLLKVIQQTPAIRAVVGLEADWPISTYSWQSLSHWPTHSPKVRTLADDLAYIIYTSGSTGQPKGIMHTHYSGLAYARLSAKTYDLQADDRIGNHSPIYFDISTFAYFASPLVGATACITPEAYTKLPASLSQLMEKERLTVWYSVPLALIQLMQRGLLEERDLSSLRWVLFAGEVFPTKHLRSLMQQWPQAQYSNIYGPTETNQCTNYNLSAPPLSDDPLPIGQVWEDTEQLIIDERDQIITDGKIGELLIRSSTMMKGYWKQAALTQNALYALPAEGGNEKIFYRTGDLVQLPSDGQLRFIGRKDFQVKIRGYRIELGAIESALLAHEAVQEAVVFATPKTDAEQELMASAIVQAGQSVDEQQLIDHLKQALPFYAVPQSIVLFDAFPRTPTGKVNRTQLKQQLLETINAPS